MALGRNRTNEDTLRCSFCRKTQESVGKLIANPDDFHRVYICDECIRVCSSILDEDEPAVEQVETEAEQEVTVSHLLLMHPLASELIEAIAEWIREESLGKDGLTELSKVRTIAQHIMQTGAAN
jgi:ATP-dependent protease Clp ATPase subunit